jgi:hypothetical protein
MSVRWHQLVFFTCIFLFAAMASAQKNLPDSVRYRRKYWSVETSVVWPIYPGIYKINFVRQVWEKKTFAGEAGLGLHIQPERTSDNEGDFSEEFISVFYRQYFWKGLHIQIENNFAYGRLRNYPSGTGSFESYAIFHDFTAGYRFVLLKKHKVALTIIPQAGGGFTSYVNSTWPRPEKPYWLVNLLAGIQF